MEQNDKSILVSSSDGESVLESCYGVRRKDQFGISVSFLDGSRGLARAFPIKPMRIFDPLYSIDTSKCVRGRFANDYPVLFRLQPQPFIYYVIQENIEIYETYWSGGAVFTIPSGEYEPYDFESIAVYGNVGLFRKTIQYQGYNNELKRILVTDVTDDGRIFGLAVGSWSTSIYGQKTITPYGGDATILSGSPVIDVRAYCQEDIDDYGLDPYAGQVES